MEKEKLPNSTLILIFGIIGIVGSCCYGLPGLLFAVIALVLAQRSLKIYQENPDMYQDASQVKTGKILAIIAIVFSLLVIAAVIGAIAFFGIEAFQNPELMQQKMEEMQGA